MIVNLTRFNGGGEIFINSDHIVSITPDIGEGTTITLRQHGYERVKETAKEIQATVNDFLRSDSGMLEAIELAEVETLESDEKPATAGRRGKGRNVKQSG